MLLAAISVFHYEILILAGNVARQILDLFKSRQPNLQDIMKRLDDAIYAATISSKL